MKHPHSRAAWLVIAMLATTGLLGLCYDRQSELAPRQLQLVQVKQRIRSALTHVPDYACLETVQRKAEQIETDQIDRYAPAGGSVYRGRKKCIPGPEPQNSTKGL